MKITFIIPQYFHLQGTPMIPHPGIAQLSAVLTEKKINHLIIDNHFHGVNSILEKISDFEPDIIGTTIYSSGYKIAYELISKIKSTFKIPIIVGGPHVSVTRKDSLENSSVDFAVKHEGEITLIELLRAIESSNDLANVKGLIWRKSNGVIVENEDRPFSSGEELDKLPMPDYSGFEMEKYLCYREKLLPLITSRGCPYLCTYCSTSLTQGREFRALNPKRVVNEIKSRVADGWTTFEIHDDCFSLDIDRAKEFCDLIINENINIKFRFTAGIRADRVDYELLKKLKKSGCTFFAYGLESADSEVLKNIKKNISTSKVKKSLEEARKVGIKTAVYFIIGLPGENYKKALKTIKFAKSLKNTSINMANALPYPGTELFNWVKSNGVFLYEPSEYLNNISYNDKIPVFETKDFPKNLRLKALKKGFALARKRDLQQKIGRYLGLFISIFYKYDFFYKFINKIFKGSSFGRKLYRGIFKKI